MARKKAEKQIDVTPPGVTDITAVKKAQFLELFPKKAGNVSECCKAVNISRQTFYRWREEDAEFCQAVIDGRESLIDFAESKLMLAINSNNITAIIFFLKTQARSRGYIERPDWEVPGMSERAPYELSDEELAREIENERRRRATSGK